MSEPKPAVVFEREVRERIADVQERQLDAIEEVLAGAIRSAVGELLGIRYDQWSGWEFDPFSRVNGNEVQGSTLRAAVTDKADELAPTLVARALEEPLHFTKADVNRLRTILKEAVLKHAETLLGIEARNIAEQHLGRLDDDR